MLKRATLLTMILSATACDGGATDHGYGDALPGPTETTPNPQTPPSTPEPTAMSPTTHPSPEPFEDGITWGLVIPTMQLVAATVDPDQCASGWTLHHAERAAEGAGGQSSLQPRYVDRFHDLSELTDAIADVYRAHPEVLAQFPTLRIAIAWPCWAQADVVRAATWQDEFLAMVRQLLAINGLTLELTLSHHDSYPASLASDAQTPGIVQAGWSHPEAAQAFGRYARSVAERFDGVLPRGTRVYLANEPIAHLMNAYLGSGNFPPGKLNAGKSFAAAARNLRDGLRLAANELAETGWQLAVAHNIRPLTSVGAGSAMLDYVFNTWLVSALHTGCTDNDFDGDCEAMADSGYLPVAGMTYYGTMAPSDELVDITGSGAAALRMAKPHMDFAPNAQKFDTAYGRMRSALAHAGNDAGDQVAIHVAEIGFSSGDTDVQADWTRDYRRVAMQHGITSMSIHTLFSAAEFAPGEWFFHLVERCEHDEGWCLTEWGEEILRVLRNG